jgi:hypothetical protein
MNNDPTTLVVIIVITLVFCIGLGWIIVKLMRRSQQSDDERLRKIYDEVRALDITSAAEPVRVVFQTYSGFLNHFREINHDVVLPPEQARELLRRLYRHNLVHACLIFFGPVIVVWSTAKYCWQMHRIRRALRADHNIGEQLGS